MPFRVVGVHSITLVKYEEAMKNKLSFDLEYDIPLPVLDKRIPKWELDQLIQRNCPICGTPPNTQICKRPDYLRVFKCAECSLYFVAPSPSENELNKFYSSYHQNHAAQSESPEQLLRRVKNLSPLDDIRIRTLKKYINLNKINVLDVGCGKGEFLFLLKKIGANCHGIDLDHTIHAYTNKLGLDQITNCNLKDLNGYQFDVIILNDVIEHPLNPVSLLNECASILKPNGKILIWTPNGDYSKHDKEQTAFRVDLEHMQYFTSQSIEILANKLDMDVLHMETLGFHSLQSGFFAKNQLYRKLKAFTKRFMVFHYLKKALPRTKSATNKKGRYHLFAILNKV